MRNVMNRNNLDRFWSNRNGTSLVEMTVLAPMLLSLALGVAEFGRALVHHHVLNKSMRDAGRFLARVPVDCPSGSSTGSVTNTSDVATAKNLAMNGAPSGGTAKLGYWTNPASITVQVDCFDNTGGTYRGRTEIPLITVSTSVSYPSLGFLSALGLPALTFQARHQQVHIGE